MKEFIEEYNRAHEELKKELRLKLKELIERLGRKTSIVVRGVIFRKAKMP